MSSAQAHLEQLLEKRVPFASVEDFIESCRGISEDDRSALWLYAWARNRNPAAEALAVPVVARAIYSPTGEA